MMQPKTEWTLQRIAELAAQGRASRNPNALFARIAALAASGAVCERHSQMADNFGVRIGRAHFGEGTVEIRTLNGEVVRRLD